VSQLPQLRSSFKPAIDSWLNQTHFNVEIIVGWIIDASCEIIASYSEPVISVSKQSGGQNSASNAGFERSRGDIICCFLNANDLLFGT